jgi:hypothetical protein
VSGKNSKQMIGAHSIYRWFLKLAQQDIKQQSSALYFKRSSQTTTPQMV